jgi:hypothetical protein
MVAVGAVVHGRTAMGAVVAGGRSGKACATGKGHGQQKGKSCLFHVCLLYDVRILRNGI